MAVTFNPASSNTGAVAPFIGIVTATISTILARQEFLAVMQGAVIGIVGIGLVEPGDDIRDAGRPIHFQRRAPSGNPGLQTQLAELRDVIGMEMREKHAVDLFQRICATAADCARS
jgi:hypothetical protein